MQFTVRPYPYHQPYAAYTIHHTPLTRYAVRAVHLLVRGHAATPHAHVCATVLLSVPRCFSKLPRASLVRIQDSSRYSGDSSGTRHDLFEKKANTPTTERIRAIALYTYLSPMQQRTAFVPQCVSTCAGAVLSTFNSPCRCWLFPWLGGFEKNRWFHVVASMARTPPF
jgi:hypothetical protein